MDEQLQIVFDWLRELVDYARGAQTMRFQLATQILVCLAATVVLAQDPSKVEPTHYKIDFENAHVQVVHINYGPYEKSKLHSHPGGVVVNITGGHLRFTDENGKVQDVYAKAGETRWFPPFQHRVENLTDQRYEGVYIVVKDSK
jgi:quercetin dioxygenase-like cupin family protein